MTWFLALANVFTIGIAAYAAILNTWYPDFAYFTVQEDEYLEWATFWGFALASFAFVVAAKRQYLDARRIPWFLAGVGLFCLVVAMEEISWGQRLLGYRPPAYFLAENFQQELNFHNLIDTSYRMLALKVVIIGYGFVFPILLAVRPRLRRLLGKWSIVAPSVWLVPSFALMGWIYESYPWRFSGEWVEAMLAAGFLAAGLHAGKSPRMLKNGAIALVALIPLTAGSVSIGRIQRASDADAVRTAEVELEALRRDFQSGMVQTRCNRHKRLYTFMVQYEQDHLLEGEFAALQAQGLPEERASFLIDPWNSPYWIRDRCTRDGARARVVYVYSFGPNRKRESTEFEIRGDDVGSIIIDTRSAR